MTLELKREEVFDAAKALGRALQERRKTSDPTLTPSFDALITEAEDRLILLVDELDELEQKELSYDKERIALAKSMGWILASDHHGDFWQTPDGFWVEERYFNIEDYRPA